MPNNPLPATLKTIMASARRIVRDIVGSLILVAVAGWVALVVWAMITIHPEPTPDSYRAVVILVTILCALVLESPVASLSEARHRDPTPAANRGPGIHVRTHIGAASVSGGVLSDRGAPLEASLVR